MTTYADALRAADLDVADVNDDERALQLAALTRPRVIAAGFDASTRAIRLAFCRAIRGDARTAGIPVLLLQAADATPDDVGLATDAGVLVLSVPPDDGTKLVAAINGVLAAQRAEPLRASLLRHRRSDTTRPA